MAYTNIDDPSAHYQGLTYRGDSSSTTSADRNLTNTGNSDLKPDWIWLFNRDTALTGGQKIVDSSRGAGSGKSLSSSRTGTEGYNDAAYGYVNNFNTDGFGVRAGTDSNRWYVDRGAGGGDKYVAYQWKANGGTTSSNTDGATTSTVQANTDAGFSIVTWTGTGSGTTLGHGLGDTPDMLIVKNLSTAVDWAVYHKNLNDAGYVLALNTTDAEVNSGANRWNNTDPTSSVFSVGTGQQTNESTSNMLAYCFAEKQGYSQFGAYAGSGNATYGTFVHTGFSPAFVMLKDISQATNWEIFDVERNPFNVANLKLGANNTAAENGSDLGNTNQNNIDILSNGFKMRTGNTDTNVNGDTYIYMAFASHPFVSSKGIPVTAR